MLNKIFLMGENNDSGDKWAMIPVYRQGRKATLPLIAWLVAYMVFNLAALF